MIKMLLVTASLTLPFYLNAGNVIDLYGDESYKAQQIVKKYAKSIDDFADLTEKVFKNSDKMSIERMTELKSNLIEDIKKEGDYLYVDLNTIHYPLNENKYTTIEVIRKGQPERLRFASPAIPSGPFKPKNDLINEMIAFGTKSTVIALNTPPSGAPCPVYHCITDFQHPELKPYLAKFNEGAIKQRELIINTLNHDPDPQRRAAAAFLIGHFSNPQEIVTLLTPHVHDKDSDVRNDVIRVIGATIAMAKITDVNPKPFLELLDSPSVTDRNKALHVLLTTLDSADSKRLIKQQGGKDLLAILKLKQPNNHRIAYQILKKISGKNYGETDFSAWKNWLETTVS
ncbi:HEAT repeat domain-containing protein [Legionella jamestowniensis]|uniref:HEAT repeat protein n=1 Tax=Legionella jamestowniensis TaxID=455 RepID=A0A0W0UJ82_9GAMM|nr:HEAT repeat domain-containing protein [Legionella jamestowniensis]KTD07686.1 hypothetical protein Ljam_1881 [Legionella jamestowniensis]SFL60648.1 HEAT repeat-containing protein [Legionella jamestowniensis DSM 19215]